MFFGLSQNQIFLASIGLLIFVVLIFLFTGVIPGLVQRNPDKITLNMMGFDNRDVFDPIISGFQKKFPHIEIEYRQVSFDNYENILINSLAAGRGPDIFMFHNSWLPKHFDKITPVSNSQLTLSQLQTLFPTVVEQDFAPEGVIFALPLYIDTLALFYNKDIFDRTGIAVLPKTWIDFQNVVAKFGVPGAAIGGSPRNIHRAADIVQLLMLQAGTPMVDSLFSRADFAGQGAAALNFYLSFSDPDNRFYTWNRSQRFSLDLFRQGALPMMFNYAYQIPLIKQRVPELNFGITGVPQPSAPGPAVSFPDYFGLAVSNKTNNAQAAWDFVLYATTDQEANKLYLQATNLPPALRALIDEYLSHPELGIFARQALIARSWPRVDGSAVEQIFNEMIDLAVEDRVAAGQYLFQAEEKITNLMKQR